MEDYHSMKRKDLQALCKKHNIPAGSANSVLADKLSQLLNVQEKQKPITRQRACLRSQVETTDEDEPKALNREAKKVRFCPSIDLVEYESGSVKKRQDLVKETGARRKSESKKAGKPVVDNDNRVDLVDDAVQIPVKLTRSRVHILEKDDVVPNVGKRQGRSVVKDVVKGKDVNEEPKANVGKTTRSKVHGSGKCGAVQLNENKQSMKPVKVDGKASESVEEPVVVRARVTRSKAQTSMDADMDPDVKPQVEKKSGRQVAKAAQLAEPAKEVVDIPVRTTRTRGQTLKEDIGNAVTKPQAEKKRTRKEMKATDQSSGNSSNVAPEDNQELPKRKSLRTRGVKLEDEDEGDKVQMIENRRVTRSRVTSSSKSKTENKVEAQRKSKRVQQLEKPLEHAVKKNVKRRESAMQPVKMEAVLHLEEPVNAPTGRVTRRKSIMQKAQGKGIDPEKTEVVLYLEEPVSGPAGRITRRKSLMQKAQIKESDKPSVRKSEPVKEIEIPDSPKTVGRNQSKGQSGSLSMIGEGSKDKENVIRSGKDAFEGKMKAAANSTISPKSKKRRGTPIIEDGPVEAEYVSPVESSKRSMRSASKSEDNVVTHALQNSAKNQLKSGLKSSGGAVVRDGSYKKRAKLSVMKQSESEDHGEKSIIERTPISKLVTFELGERVVENEHTPAIDGSHRRFTRSAIRSNREEPRQSAIKEQPIGDVQLSSHKVPKFRHDSAVKTAPGRVTRSGIKHAENVASCLSERVDKVKQQCESAHKRKPFDDLQMSSHEVAESRRIPDVTIGAQSETPKVTDQILAHVGDMSGFSASESVRLPAEVAKESKSKTAITMDSLSSLFDDEASGYESPIKFKVETPPGTSSNVKTSSEAAPDAISDGSNVQNQAAYGKSVIFSEAEVQALNAAESVLKYGRPEAYEKELAILGSMSKGLQSDVGAEEPVVSVCVTVGTEESAGHFGDVNFTCDSVPYSRAFEQPGIKSKSEGEDDTEKAEGERSAQKQVMQEPVFEDNNVHGNIEELQSSDMPSRDVSDGELDGETNKYDTVEQLTAGDVFVGLSVDDDDTKVDIITAHDSSPKQNELSMVKDISFGLGMDRFDIEKDLVDTVKEPTQGLELEAVPSTIDVCEVPILGESDVHKMPSFVKSDGVDGRVNATRESDGEDLVLSSEDGGDDADNTYKEHESNSKMLIHDGVSDASPVESSRRSIRSASKSEGKAVVVDGSSKKRAKSSVMKQSDSEDHGEKSNIERTPISKLVTFELGGRVIDNEHTPAIDGSHRRFTRSAVGSNIKEPRQSAIKEQPIGDVQLSSHKVPKFRHDSAVKTQPIGLRVTRSGIKHAGNVASGLSERVDKKKQPCESAHQRKPFDDLQMSSHEVAEFRHIPDVTIGAQSEIPEVKDQILEHVGDISASESARLPADVAKASKSETATTIESLSSLFDEEASGVELPINFEVETPSIGKDISFGPGIDRHGVANDLVDTVKEPTQGLELEAVPSAIDVCEVPVFGVSDGVGGNMPSHGEDHLPSGVEGEEADNANSKHQSNPKPLTDDIVCDTSTLGTDEYNVSRLSEPMTDPSSANDMHKTLSGKDSNFCLATERHGVEDYAGKKPAPEPEFEVTPSTANDVHKMPSLGKPDGADGGVNATRESDGEDLVSSGENRGDDADTSFLGKDDYANITRLFEPTLDPSSVHDIVETPISGDDDICSDIAMDRSGVADIGKEHAQEYEFELAPSAGSDVQEILSLGSANATKECETDSVPSTGGNMPSDGEHLVLSGGDGEDKAYNPNKEHKSKLKRLTDGNVSDTSVFGKDDDYNITGLCEPTSDPSTNDIVEAPFSVNDIFGESDNAIYDQKSPSKPITDNDDIEDGVTNGPKELEIGLEPSVTNYCPNVPVLGNNADRNGQDGEPEQEHEHEHLTKIDVCAMGEQFVGGVGSAPDQNENMPVISEDLIRSTMAVDAREESLQDIDKDAVSDYFGDIYGLENAVGVMDTENGNWNDQKVTRTSEPDESAFSKGSGGISPDMNTEQITEEAELTIGSDHAFSDKKEKLGTTIDHNLGSGKSMEGCSNSAVEMLDSRLVDDLKVQETPTREEVPVGDTLSDAPISLKEDIIHKQEKTQKENMFVDWGNYSSRMDGFQKLVSENKNDLQAKSTKDDQVLDLQSSARASSSIKESSSVAADFVNSVNKLEHISRNLTDRESDQDVDLLKGNANMQEEDFNWSDSHVKGGREHAAVFATSAHFFDHGNNNFNDLPLKSLFTTPGTTRNDFKGENTRGNAIGQENEMCGVSNLEHFPNKYFEGEVDCSIDWLGKNTRIEFKGDQYDLSSEAASTGKHCESSDLNVKSTHSGVLGEKETQL